MAFAQRGSRERSIGNGWTYGNVDVQPATRTTFQAALEGGDA